MQETTFHLAFPFQIKDQRVAAAAEDVYLDQLIEQVLFTTPGERVNRPDFGSGVERLVFRPDSSAVATAAQHSLQASLQSALAGVVTVEAITVTPEREQMSIAIVYRQADGARRSVSFTR